MNAVVIGLCVLGAACWALCALGNASILRLQLRRQPDQPVPSLVPFVGGIAGLLAWSASYASLAALFAWPSWMQAVGAAAIVLLDFGSGPYVVIIAMAVVGSLMAAKEPETVCAAEQIRIDAAVGCLLGTAVGDALGLPMEGLSRRRLARWYPTIDRQHLIFHRGLCSDDTEHNVMVALSICVVGDDVERFTGEMRGRLRGWLLALPAGVGFATLRAILKLWLFIPRRWQGVFSAGNGAAMRAPLLGVLFADQPETLRAFVRASTRLTHTDPQAEAAALAVALAAREAARGQVSPIDFVEVLRSELAIFDAAGQTLLALIERAANSALAGDSSKRFAEILGLERGVSGYAYHTVPVALHGWFAHPHDYASAVAGVIECGGDTDTVAAITGGIVGAGVGRAGIPPQWLSGVIELPASTRWLERVAEAALRRVDGLPFQPPREPLWLLRLARNLVFLVIVLGHGFRRLLPPY